MSKALVPHEQKQVLFYDDEITAVRIGDVVYVPIRPICDYLGIDWSGQLQRINRDPILSQALMSVGITPTDIEEGSRRPRTSEMACLPLDYLNGWLFGVNANRVKAEIRDRVLRYQRECYRVLANAFQDMAIVQSAPSTLIQVYEMGLAIAAMAKEQMVFDQRLGAAEEKLVVVDELVERVTAVEEKLSPSAYVTQEQASQISQAVKAVALALGKKTKRNEFGACYGELYRRYGITSYKALPAHKFEDALNFLTEWHQDITTGVPF